MNPKSSFGYGPLLGLASVILLGTLAWAAVRYASPSAEERARSAVSAVMAGEMDRAEADLQALSTNDDYLNERRFVRGAILLRSGHPGEALPYLAAVEPVDALEQPALLLLGECYYRLHRYAEAENCFLLVIADDPDQVLARRWLGSIYYDLGTIQAAIRQIEHVTRLAPDDYRPHRFLGIIYFDVEKYSEAATSIRRALDLDPPSTVAEELRLQLAKTRIELNDFTGALEALADAPDLVEDFEARVIKGRAAFGTGDIRTAAKLAEDLLDEQAGHREALLLSARIAQHKGQEQDAVAFLERILAEEPHDHEARYQLALTLRRLGDHERSARELERYETSLALKARADSLYVESDMNPTEPRFREELAEVCDELGKHEHAEMWRRAAEALRVRKTLRDGTP